MIKTFYAQTEEEIDAIFDSLNTAQAQYVVESISGHGLDAVRDYTLKFA